MSPSWVRFTCQMIGSFTVRPCKQWLDLAAIFIKHIIFFWACQCRTPACCCADKRGALHHNRESVCCLPHFCAVWLKEEQWWWWWWCQKEETELHCLEITQPNDTNLQRLYGVKECLQILLLHQVRHIFKSEWKIWLHFIGVSGYLFKHHKEVQTKCAHI